MVILSDESIKLTQVTLYISFFHIEQTWKSIVFVEYHLGLIVPHLFDLNTGTFYQYRIKFLEIPMTK